MIKWVARIWWTIVILIDGFALLFIFGPGSVQRWQIDAIYSVLNWMGV